MELIKAIVISYIIYKVVVKVFEYFGVENPIKYLLNKG